MAHPDRGAFNQRINKGVDGLRKLLSTAREFGLFASLFPFACGYVTRQWAPGLKKHLHDHEGKFIVTEPNLDPVLYNKRNHGEIVRFINEGEPVPGFESIDGKKAIHRHQGLYKSGPYEYQWE